VLSIHELIGRAKEKNRARLRARRNKKNRQTDTGQYSLAPFDNRRAIFVHIPKTGGISVSTALFGNLAGGHTRITEYRNIFSEKEFSQYYKFTFVRNPWDRLYSAYCFLKAGGINEDDSAWAVSHLSGIDTFEDFVMHFLNEEVIYTEVHLVPQYKFICYEDGQSPVDFIGRFENLESDFNVVAAKIAPGAKLAHMNSSAKNKTASADMLFTQAMQEKVAILYARDIELFGYQFNNGI
jgi:hypothetical protein